MKYSNQISALTFILALALLGNSMYMTLKAEFAQYLIASSWQSITTDQPAAKPWPWADTFAIAKIEVPRLKLELYVMNDDTGESLAFGPGHLPKTSLPASYGHSMIAGHRDSHFDFIKDLVVGDEIIIRNYLGEQKTYQIRDAYQMDTRTESLHHMPGSNLLTLITCYPFSDITTGGPLRWIVDASPVI